MSHEALKARLIEALAPADSWAAEGAALRSDFDLNPDADWTTGPLKPAAVLVAIDASGPEPRVILTRRSDTLTSHTGQIALPGGRLDPGETAIEAALREAWEEIGLDPATVEVLGVGDAYQTGSDFLITPVVGWLAAVPRLTASPDEVAEIFDVPWDFLMDPAHHRRDSMEFRGARRWFWAMPWQDRYIWGATAGVLRGLRIRLYGEATA